MSAAVLALVVATTVGVGATAAEAETRNTSARTHTADGHRGHGPVAQKSEKSEKWKKSHKSHSHGNKKPSAAPKPPVEAAPAPTTPPVTAPTTPPAAEVAPPAAAGGSGASSYPLHTGIVATTFWVGEIFDANAEDGSQMLSTYDANWFANYGGCDGVTSNGTCTTEKRVAANGFFPSSMTPKQNPFYLDLPYDDVNDKTGFANRGSVIPWANDPAYAGRAGDASISLMKNRWVKLMKDGQTCYGQIADAGPGEYHDSAYVFGSNDARPANARYGGAGMDVSPALNGCLNFAELDGDSDVVDWQFVEAADVPAGPWLTVSSSDNKVIN
ncbi:hypothetical protein [Microterricola pindariensis]|uniref:Secreted protein n=1 Tax=Microterricola pindariensis TaxID=478010 RepID=A0ABX5AUC3_9MICO|nr:hypothetical protein [Microterricola pindariensis]PPL15925.1 hypothetical protein GY24_13430 [Microterricola pindariensis]